MEDITKLFCLVDDFCRDIEKNFADKLLPGGKKPTRVPEITHSEIITIILLYQHAPLMVSRFIIPSHFGTIHLGTGMTPFYPVHKLQLAINIKKFTK